jgi:hypothetical protein
MPGPKTSDYFAELYVAGRFAEAGWNVYFPHRDQGFDFIISKDCGIQGQIIRPVQVKGKYPTEGKGDWPLYGYIGGLSQLHDDMVLAIPFFSYPVGDMPICTAYLPRSLLRKVAKGYRCQPASFKGSTPTPRRDYKKFFDKAGLDLLLSPDWGQLGIGID